MKKTMTFTKGVTTVMVIIFLGIFLVIMATVSSFALEQEKYAQALLAREQALSAAESGIEYYRWFLYHNPNNLTNATSTPGPYPYTVKDPETGNLIGTAQITVVGKTQCGAVQWVDIYATGTSAISSVYKRTVFARFMKPSVAGYSYLLNSNVWAGPTRTITGPYYSNGGIRMDAVSNSDVSSAVSTWTCDSSFGCSPTDNSADGVFGSSTNSALWHFPATSIDFSGGIGLQLSTIKTAAQNYGVYFAPSTGTAGKRGYHFIFLSDGTVNVYRVTGVVSGIKSSPDGSTFTNDYGIIASETSLGNYSIPASCRVIFAEDNIWVEGTVKNPVLIASADYSGSGVTPNAYLPNNIYYAAYDGSAGLSVVADGNVLLPLNSPDTMEIHGIFVAHNGLFGRNYYQSSGTYQVPSAYSSYVLQTQLTTIGTVVSNLRTGTAWLDGSGNTVSGYQTRIDSYDELQALAPPPFTPSASANPTIINWDER
jgi:hypothetical protein